MSTSFTLAELQKLAKKNEIDIQKKGKTKVIKKTKNELYDELKGAGVSLKVKSAPKKAPAKKTKKKAPVKKVAPKKKVVKKVVKKVAPKKKAPVKKLILAGEHKNMGNFVEDQLGIIHFIKKFDNSKEGKSVGKRVVEKLTDGLYDLIDTKFKEIFSSKDVKYKNVWEKVKYFKSDVMTYLSQTLPSWLGYTDSIIMDAEEQFEDVWPNFLKAYKSDRGEDEIYKKMLSRVDEEP